jgi:hypothetical protein
VVSENNGGYLHEYVAYWRTVALGPDLVQVIGPCVSACTMLMAYVPKERICFNARSYLAFHQARSKTVDDLVGSGVINMPTTQWMIDEYPADIRDWLVANGAVTNVPGQGYWALMAEELWKMGYGKC